MQFEGGWVLYLEPTKIKGRKSRGYFAAAKVEKVIPDPTKNNMYLALIQAGTYTPFLNGVPFSNNKVPIERGLLENGKLSGRAQASVRPCSEKDFNRILDIGIGGLDFDLDDGETRVGDAFEEIQEPFGLTEERRRRLFLSNKIVRDRNFRNIVLDVYDSRCAFTGLKIINGGGRAEVEAAHIMPVERNGNDHVCNGLALSRTPHWMFDRGLLSLSDKFEIMFSRHINDVDSVERLVNSDRIAIVPDEPNKRPHPDFLNWHRENCFKT